MKYALAARNLSSTEEKLHIPQSSARNRLVTTYNKVPAQKHYYDGKIKLTSRLFYPQFWSYRGLGPFPIIAIAIQQ